MDCVAQTNSTTALLLCTWYQPTNQRVSYSELAAVLLAALCILRCLFAGYHLRLRLPGLWISVGSMVRGATPPTTHLFMFVGDSIRVATTVVTTVRPADANATLFYRMSLCPPCPRDMNTTIDYVLISDPSNGS